MVIDCHTHIFPPWVIAERAKYIGADPVFGDLYSAPKARLANADDLIASMDHDGIDVSVAVNLGWRSTELCARTNDYVMESVARYPKRLAGFGMVDPNSPDALKEIERCRQGGLKGIGEVRLDAASIDAASIDGAPLAECLDAMADQGLVLLVHASEPVGHEYAGKGDTTPGRLYRLITRFPKLRVIAAHWGGGLPFYTLMREVRVALGNVYYDTAASPFLYRPEIYRRVIDLVGAERILLGSDFPLMTQSRLLKEIRSQGLSADQEQLILAGNAARLLGLTQ